MTSVKALSQVVGLIHAMPHRQSWEPVVDKLAACVNATACTIATRTGPDRTVLATSIPAEAIEAYGSYYHKLDFVMSACESGPLGLVTSGWNLVAANKHTEFYNDWQRRHRMTDGLQVRLATPVPSTLIISAPPADEPFATSERIMFVDALVPHLQHALSAHHSLKTNFGRRPPDLRAPAHLARHGTITLDRAGHVIDLNPAATAILTHADGVRLRANTIEAYLATDNNALRAAIARAISTRAPRVGGHIVCRRASGKRPYVVQVAPLDEVGAGPYEPHAVLVITDPEQRPQPTALLLRDLFGLTAAEARTALQLLDGQTLAECAAATSISQATVKTHLHRIFTKTGTHRQTELVRLLLALIP